MSKQEISLYEISCRGGLGGEYSFNVAAKNWDSINSWVKEHIITDTLNGIKFLKTIYIAQE
jgi:hypothetical protein